MSTLISEPKWLTDLRTGAAANAAELALPSWKGTTGWEFTDLGNFTLDNFNGASANGTADAEQIFKLEAIATHTQTDGEIEVAANLLPVGVTVSTLEQAAETHAQIVERHLGKIATTDGNSDIFAVINSRDWQGGVFVHVTANTRVEGPVSLKTISGQDGSMINRRVLVVVEEGAEIDIFDQTLSTNEESETVVNSVVELVVGRNSQLTYIAGQNLNEKSWIFGTQRATIHADGTLNWGTLAFGSARGRVRTDTVVAGSGAEAVVTGAYAPRGRQHIDFDTKQEHAAANTRSDLAFRGILAGRSSAVWRGMIKVDPGAQQTDAFQECRNLLLSKRAHVDAIPGLEILANDVRCTHAAAIAQIDDEQLFYLESRGLNSETAKQLVVEGFLAELVMRFREGYIRDQVAEALEQRLVRIQ